MHASRNSLTQAATPHERKLRLTEKDAAPCTGLLRALTQAATLSVRAATRVGAKPQLALVLQPQ